MVRWRFSGTESNVNLIATLCFMFALNVKCGLCQCVKKETDLQVIIGYRRYIVIQSDPDFPQQTVP